MYMYIHTWSTKGGGGVCKGHFLDGWIDRRIVRWIYRWMDEGWRDKIYMCFNSNQKGQSATPLMKIKINK